MRLTLALHCDGFRCDCPNAIHTTTQAHAATHHAVTRLLALANQQNWDIRPIQLDDEPLGVREETRAYCSTCGQRLNRWAAEQALARMSEPDATPPHQPTGQ